MEKQPGSPVSPVSAPSSPTRSEADGESQSDKLKTATPVEQKTVQVLSTQQQQVIKSEDYRKLFHLPLEEMLVQDFNCAFQKKILLQGHMYLFEQYICFYSNIFGYEKKKVLPLKDVAFVRKAWTAGLFPNAIEIGAWGKKYFFASFLSRDEAYRLIVNGWSRHSGHARAITDASMAGSSSDLQGSPLQATLSLPASRHITTEIADSQLCIEDGEEKQVLPKSESSTPVKDSTHSKKDSMWKIEDITPPPLPSEFKTVMESEFPVDVEDFFELFFSDNAINFIETFHKRCGDEEFRCTNWSPHPRFGHVRDISFRHPVNLYFGPKSAQCSETQRFRVYRNSHLVIETSQQMSEIPYADYFHVEVRWDVERVPKDFSFHSSVRISMNVEFSKKTLWRSKIEQATLDECKETYSIWVREAYNVLSSKACEANGEVASDSALLEPDNAPEMLSLIADEETRMDTNLLQSRRKANTVLRGMRKLWRSVLRFLSENPMALAVLAIAILAILTQAATLMTISHRPPASYYDGFHATDRTGKCMGGSNAATAEAVAWLEQRARHVKEEMALAEARLQSLHQDLSLLKLHMNLFEQLRPGINSER